jgi:hypothetical protein
MQALGLAAAAVARMLATNVGARDGDLGARRRLGGSREGSANPESWDGQPSHSPCIIGSNDADAEPQPAHAVRQEVAVDVWPSIDP